jgi:arabinogalactan endo-1,4-beta-galactosidase
MPAMQELKNFLEGSAGISATAVDTPETATWYTIDGRRLNAKPTTRGLYIHDGKKIIIN